MISRNCRILTVAVAATLAAAAFSQTFLETEPNDDKANANAVTLGAGAFSEIRGNSVGSTGAGIDTFRVKTAADARGVYLYRLILTTTGTAGHTGFIRGLRQTAVALGAWPCAIGAPTATDSALQISSTATTPVRFVQWYGFGKEEEIYYRVTGTSSTTADYVVVFEKAVVAVTNLGRFKPGQITISTIGRSTVDTDIHVFDCNLNAIPGYSNDDESAPGGGTGAALQSILRRDYRPGRYYLAIGQYNTATHLGSPCDDDFRTGSLLDFPNAVTSSVSTASTTLLTGFSVTDADGARIFEGQEYQPYQIHWYSFTVLGSGDVNGDCCVDDTDLAIVATEFGNSGADLPADVNGDGVVDDTDLAIVATEFGLGC